MLTPESRSTLEELERRKQAKEDPYEMRLRSVQ